MSKYFNRNLFIIIAIFIIIFSFSFTLIIFLENYLLYLLILLCFAMLYMLLCLIINPIKVFLFTAVFLTTLGVKLLFNSIPYIGGVGAGDIFIGTPHITLLFGLISFCVYKFKNKYQNTTESHIIDYDIFILILFTVFCFISALIAPYKKAAYPQLQLYLVLFFNYILIKKCVTLLNEVNVKRLILDTISISVLLELFLCLLQIKFNGPLGLSILGEGSWTGQIRSGVNLPIVSGTFVHPGPLSLFFLIAFCFLFPYILQRASTNIVQMLGFIASIIGIILTFSRTSLLILLLMILLITGMLFHKKKYSIIKMVLLIIFIFIVIIISYHTILSRFESLGSQTDNQFNNRLVHFLLAWEYIKKSPIIGYGLNNWEYITSSLGISYLGLDSFFYENPVHNIYLLLWFEGGILLLGTFLGLYVFSLIKAYNQYKNGKLLSLGAMCSMISIAVYGISGWGLFNGFQLLYLYYLIISIVNSEQRYWMKE